MNTPICDFVESYRQSRAVRLHMPGHKGKAVLGPEALDITEVPGADVLYAAGGIVAESQENASALFGSARTLYSCEGSSLAIRAMLFLALLCRRGEERPLILAARNVHKTFVSAAALLDFDVQWLWGGEGLLSCRVSPEELDHTLRHMERKPLALYVTSPDYLGNLSDIAGLSQVCHTHGILLLVDNAHGAYLRFLPKSLHPMQLGADLCCDSAHKTLPVLTGGAYLHLSRQAPPELSANAERAMALFASTSPSWLILQSLDRANRYLAEEGPELLARCAEVLAQQRQRLQRQGWQLVGDEPLKLSLAPKARGYTGEELAELLRREGFVCEFSDPDYLVCMVSPAVDAQELERLTAFLLALPACSPIPGQMPPLGVPCPRMSIRQASLSPAELLPLHQCRGRVLAAANVSCPPAIPILVCGEEIDEAAMAAMAYYGLSHCPVVKK